MGDKHTPRPWRRFGGYMDGYGIVGDGKTVVKMVGDNSMDLDRHSADATLIAAAPDLLRACQVALDALGCDRTRQDRLGAQKIIHAAVIKAKGGA